MAAGTFYWRGTQSTAWNDGRNWVDGAGTYYATARYPGSSAGDADTVYYDAALSTGAFSTDGFDASALANLNLLAIGPEYNGTIGTAATPLKIPQASTVRVVGRASPGLYLHATGGLAALWMFDAVLLHLRGNWGLLHLFRGNCLVATGSTIGVLESCYTSSQVSDVKLTIEGGCTLPTGAGGSICQVIGGTISCASPLPLLYMSGGQWTQNAATTTINLVGSATFAWESGNLAWANIWAGTLDGSRSSHTRAATAVVVFPPGTVNTNNGLGNCTIAALANYGGTVIKTPGT